MFKKPAQLAHVGFPNTLAISQVWLWRSGLWLGIPWKSPWFWSRTRQGGFHPPSPGKLRQLGRIWTEDQILPLQEMGEALHRSSSPSWCFHLHQSSSFCLFFNLSPIQFNHQHSTTITIMPQFPFSSRGKMLTAALNADPVKSGEAYDVPAISQGLDDEQIHEGRGMSEISTKETKNAKQWRS